MTTPPPQWGTPPSTGPWASPPPAAPPSAWGTPPPTWGGPPQWGAADASAAGGFGPPPGARANSVIATVSAHLALWIGLLLVALTSRLLFRFAYRTGGVPVEVFDGLLGAYSVLPVVAALVIAGRGATLRLVGLLGAVVLLIGATVPAVVRLDGPVYILLVALSLVGLGTWIAVRRHSAKGYFVLVPAAALALLWWGPGPGIDLRIIPYEHGFPAVLTYLWSDLPILAFAVVGLISSFLRPTAPPERDARAFAVVGGLVAVAAVATVVVVVL